MPGLKRSLHQPARVDRQSSLRIENGLIKILVILCGWWSKGRMNKYGVTHVHRTAERSDPKLLKIIRNDRQEEVDSPGDIPVVD
jgi:hypothetical protein